MTHLDFPNASSAGPSGACESVALPAEVLQLLERSGAMEELHTGRTLFAHLYGTYRLLKAWGQVETVCLAGLFHSIYGTNVFPLAPRLERSTLQRVIGVEGEALSWLFCNIERPKALVQALQQHGGKAFALAGRCDQGAPPESTLVASAAQVRALAEIECANLIEQGSWGNSLRRFYCMANDQPGLLSAPAVMALREGWARQLQMATSSAQKALHSEQIHSGQARIAACGKELAK